MHIPTLAPEKLFEIAGMPITNTIINVWMAIILFLILGLVLRKRITLKPTKIQNFCEYFLELLLGYFDQVTGDRKKTMRFLPAF